ncbi:hypothetical protein Tco_1564562, partial [Tanacetum coccineum]
LIIADLMKKYPFIPHRPDEDYHFIKDDIPLVSVYSIGNVLFRGMQILDAFLTYEIRATVDYKEYEIVFVRVEVPMNQPQLKLVEEEIEKMVEGEEDEESYASEFVDSVFNDDDDFSTRIEPESHKENLKVVDEDEVNDKVKQDEKKDNDTEKTDDAAKEKDTDGHTNHTLVETYATGSIETRNEQMQT